MNLKQNILCQFPTPTRDHGFICHEMINIAVFIFYLLSRSGNYHTSPTPIFVMSQFKRFQFEYEIIHQSQREFVLS